jgi:hypothetical protein
MVTTMKMVQANGIIKRSYAFLVDGKVKKFVSVATVIKRNMQPAVS